MHISDFDYDLPTELIAREPVRPRDGSRMMVLNRRTGAVIDSSFRALPWSGCRERRGQWKSCLRRLCLGAYGR